jgi:hypothetical protein
MAPVETGSKLLGLGRLAGLRGAGGAAAAAADDRGNAQSENQSDEKTLHLKLLETGPCFDVRGTAGEQQRGCLTVPGPSGVAAFCFVGLHTRYRGHRVRKVPVRIYP